MATSLLNEIAKRNIHFDWTFVPIINFNIVDCNIDYDVILSQ